MEHIWRRWYRPLAAYVRGRLAGSELEDAMQELMLRVFRGLESYDGRWALSTWLWTVARNFCADQARVASQPPQSSVSPENLASARQGPTPEHQFLEREIDRAIDAEIATWAALDRDVFWLALRLKTPYQEIADSCGVALHEVKNRVHRGRQRLRRVLGEYHHG